jgi:hypothetical protein
MFNFPPLSTILYSLVLAATLSTVQVQALPSKLIPVKPTTDPLVPADSIVTNTFLSKDTLWILKGFVMVKSGVTLTIEPGTTIQGDATVKGTLMIDRGGYLIAAGTAAAPITFQGPNDDRGTWGGLVLLGKAFSNQDLGGHDLNYEGLDWALHSGEDDNDSSGVLTYIRVVNPGFAITIDRDLNGLTLCTIGRKTIIHHIQVHRGDDDGIEWFGGSVNTSHLVVTNAVDDSYDTDHGYNGNSQYVIAIQSAETNRPRPGLPAGEVVGDRGLECGSSIGGPGRYTNPVWKNITVIENGRSGGAFEAKEECGGSYENMVLVAGGVTAETSDWAMQFLSPRTVNGIVSPTPHINFTKTIITGNYKKKYNILSGTLAQIALATQILDLKIKAFPFSEINSYGLRHDLSPSHPDIIADQAGAIVGNDLWYKGWTLPNTVSFPLGDANQYNLSTQPAGGRSAGTAVKLNKPLEWDFALFQSPPLNGFLNVPACQAWVDGVDHSQTLRSKVLPFSTLLSNGDRLYTSRGQSGYIFGAAGIHNLRVRLVLLTGEVIDESFFWETLE